MPHCHQFFGHHRRRQHGRRDQRMRTQRSENVDVDELRIAYGEKDAEWIAAEFATVAGALAVTVAGAQPSLPTRAAVDDF